MFEHSLVYTYEKLYLMTVLLAAIILTTVLAAYTYSANLYRWRKNALLALLFVVLTLQTGQFLAVVSPPPEVGFFVKLQGASLCLLGPLFFFTFKSACIAASFRVRMWCSSSCGPRWVSC